MFMGVDGFGPGSVKTRMYGFYCFTICSLQALSFYSIMHAIGNNFVISLVYISCLFVLSLTDTWNQRSLFESDEVNVLVQTEEDKKKFLKLLR